ncbi:hypothetical protein CDAR_495851 [Caerostris darwini]|uniref:Uncharacterized protein n=1 Tax=Caerostris darwini TaxID=1538125 RepID=A0AAV4RBW5_9ARAC|nr:hypothetical protein CDAR_495851 [Caerostris darwini]
MFPSHLERGRRVHQQHTEALGRTPRRAKVLGLLSTYLEHLSTLPKVVPGRIGHGCGNPLRTHHQRIELRTGRKSKMEPDVC